jgi:hypothetical protein
MKMDKTLLNTKYIGVIWTYDSVWFISFKAKIISLGRLVIILGKEKTL